jgi:hypothetical protein
MCKGVFFSPPIGRLAVLILLALLAVSPSYGFCPSNGWRCGFGLVGMTHEDITTKAIQQVDTEFFSKPHLTVGMKHALADIVAANAEVDQDQTLSEKHFDGESFDKGKARILNLSEMVVTGLQSNDVRGARESLGGLLHTLQDFYAHSDFIETGNSGAYPALWQPSVPVSPLAAKGADTCQACNLIFLPPTVFITDCSHNIVTSLLTSGYYGGEDAQPQTTRKCRHGGIFDSGPGPLGGINKDTLSADFSPHSNFHSSAASSAVAATEAFLRDLRNRLTERQLQQLLGVGPTLAMAIDTTGSMSEVIAGVRDQAIQIVNTRLGTDEEPSLYVLSPFNDPFIGPLTVTSDPDEYKAAISALTASGGGDCPELAMAGMLDALGASQEGGELFLWTDADAKDAGLVGNVLALADSKNIPIYPILFGSCAFRSAAQAPPSKGAFGSDPAFVRLASETGGQLFQLVPSEAGQIAGLADAIVRTNAVDLLAVADTLAGAGKAYTVPVDSTLSRAVFALSGSTDLQLVRPNGTPVHPTDSDVQTTTVTSGTVITVLHPAAGAWQVTAAGTAGIAFSLAVKGEGDLSFDRFEFVEVGGSGHQGYFALPGMPVVGDATTAAAAVSGPVANVHFELHDRAGAILSTLSLAPEAGGDPTQLFGSVTLPSQPFVVYARGTDTAGVTFQRVLVKSIAPQTVRVSAPLAVGLQAGKSTTYTFEVKNSGPAGTFKVVASDDRGFVVSALPVQFDLAKNRKQKVSVKLLTPVGSAVGTRDTLTVSVESVTTSGVGNFAVVDSMVSPPAP